MRCEAQKSSVDGCLVRSVGCKLSSFERIAHQPEGADESAMF